ncbi:hypothetical protein KKC45_03990 [Patescibacteria group bacterium]|nr:hypothetical protein [Patescibacteria group bacterium]
MEFDIKTIIDFILLATLLGSASWLFAVMSRYGGSVGKSFRIIGWGSLVMASSHLTEVITFYLSVHDIYALMFFHRFLATVGFVVIAYGFKTLVKK